VQLGEKELADGSRKPLGAGSLDGLPRELILPLRESDSSLAMQKKCNWPLTCS
jgi:hypothetical protein